MRVDSSYLYDISTRYYSSLGDGRYLVAREKEQTTTEESAQLSKEPTPAKIEQNDKTDSTSPEKLDPSQEELLQELQSRDAEVRQHEAAHQSAGAPTGAASYTYQQGPDGKMYAIGGEVSVTLQSGATPEETIANAQAVIASAMAPSDPSPQDHAVATSARLLMIQAQQEKNELSQEELGKSSYIKSADDEQNNIDKHAIEQEPFELLA